MASAAPDTGHGASLTFSTSAYSYSWTSITQSEKTRPAINDTHLASTTVTYRPGDLTDNGTFSCNFLWDQDVAEPAPGTTTETITITYPIAPGNTTATTKAGTGFVESVKPPDLSTNEMQIGTLTVRWAAAPTVTPGS